MDINTPSQGWIQGEPAQVRLEPWCLNPPGSFESSKQLASSGALTRIIAEDRPGSGGQQLCVLVLPPPPLTWICV